MLGSIIGDIAGSSQEFDNLLTYDFKLFEPYDSYTDDTICTVAVADAILHGRSYRDSMLDWCSHYPNPMGAYGTGFMRWLRSPDHHPYGSYGNGSAMRVSPVGDAFDTEEEVEEQAAQSAAISHDHPEGIKGAIATAEAILALRRGEGKDGVAEVARKYYGEHWRDNLAQPGVFVVDCMGSVPLAFHHLLESTSFEDAIRRTIAYGGDTDTMGAIVGGMAEYLWGIPQAMADKARTYLPADMLEVLDEFTAKYPSKIIS